jgi:fructokinase
MFAGIEAGGTKFVCVVGDGPDAIARTARIPVRDPASTLADAIGFLRRARADGLTFESIGIGSFGPVELREQHPRFGQITTTPKPGWAWTDVRTPFLEFGVPVGFDNDVNAAALAEGRWGAAQGLSDFVYLTIGTGIGGGVVANGQLLHGMGHPEIGHIAVPRMPGDDFAGWCPFHGDCFEGMGAGPAIERRFGPRAEALEGADAVRAADLAGFYLAAGVRALVYVLAVERVVVGGGLGMMPGVLEAARRHLADQMHSYAVQPEHSGEQFIAAAGLGGLAGPAGTLLLAQIALATRSHTEVSS